jgi:hypothetical protein
MKRQKRKPDPTTKAVQTRLATGLVTELEKRARDEGISLSDYVRRLLLKHLGPLEIERTT